MNPPSLGLVSQFNASIIDSDGDTIYIYNGSIPLPFTAGEINNFDFDSTSFMPGATTNITITYQFNTTIPQGKKL
jgi:hypothetical protein